MFETGKKLIVEALDRLGYRLVRKESEAALKDDMDRRVAAVAVDIARGERTISHLMPHGYPVAKTAFIGEIEPTEADEAIAQRLLNFYNKSIKEEPIDHRDLWTALRAGPHSDFIDLLAKNDPGPLARYLCNMSRHAVTHGLSQGDITYNDLLSREIARSYVATLILDKLVCLAEALGCLPYENPESGRFGVNIYTDVEDLIGSVEKAMNLDITHPPILGGLFGLDTSKGVLDFRYICAMYTAWRIRQILKDHERPAVCEIGAGIGCVANVSHRLGIKNYTIFDLPYVGVISGYYLMKSLTQETVTLYGDENNENSSIRILPYWHFNKTDRKCFDLTLNQDSFPEIDSSIVDWYLDTIVFNTRDFFLSINQEAQVYLEITREKEVLVSELLKNRHGYDLIYRFPCWIRAGFTEELYRITQ